MKSRPSSVDWMSWTVQMFGVVGGRGRLRFAHEALLRVLVVAPLVRQELRARRGVPASGRAPCRPRPSRRPRAGTAPGTGPRRCRSADRSFRARARSCRCARSTPSADARPPPRPAETSPRRRGSTRRAATSGHTSRRSAAAMLSLLLHRPWPQRGAGERQPAAEDAPQIDRGRRLALPSARSAPAGRPIASAARFRAT